MDKNKIDLDIDLDLGIDLDKETKRMRENLKILEMEAEYKRKEILQLEEKYEYYTGFKKHLYITLNNTYKTMLVAFFMFLGYSMAGFKYIGLDIWKTPTNIIFYTLFTLGFIILTVGEYLREKNKEEGK